MDQAQRQAVLASLEFAEAMSSAAISRLAELAHGRRYAKGEYLFREGEPGGDLSLIVSGKVRLEIAIPGRGSRALLTVGAGEFAGWSGLLSGSPMTASAVAIEPTELLVCPAAALRDLCDADDAFGHQLMRAMAAALSRRLVATRLQLLDLFSLEESPPPAGGASSR